MILDQIFITFKPYRLYHIHLFFPIITKRWWFYFPSLCWQLCFVCCRYKRHILVARRLDAGSATMSERQTPETGGRNTAARESESQQDNGGAGSGGGAVQTATESFTRWEHGGEAAGWCCLSSVCWCTLGGAHLEYEQGRLLSPIISQLSRMIMGWTIPYNKKSQFKKKIIQK